MLRLRPHARGSADQLRQRRDVLEPYLRQFPEDRPYASQVDLQLRPALPSRFSLVASGRWRR